MPNDAPAEGDEHSRLPSRTEALRHFATFAGPTQSQQHIKPLHEYVTARLVLEGGFAPDELRPRPPLRPDAGATVLCCLGSWTPPEGPPWAPPTSP